MAALAAPDPRLDMPTDSAATVDSPSSNIGVAFEGAAPDTGPKPLLQEVPSNAHPFVESSEDSSDGPPMETGPPESSDSIIRTMRWLGLHHSSTNGRNVGMGKPLVGTSWLNRPYYIGAEIGTLWITRSIYDDVTRDVDANGGFFLGWDRDYYWGGELRFDWSTPELINESARDARRTDSLFIWNYSTLYYPWGDAQWRPYWRAGIGNTHVDFPFPSGNRHDEWLLNIPLGVGVKYPIRHWLAARAEFTDNLSIDPDGDLATENVLTLNFALEWRYGAHPQSYWPWNPSRHIW